MLYSSHASDERISDWPRKMTFAFTNKNNTIGSAVRYPTSLQKLSSQCHVYITEAVNASNTTGMHL